MKRCKHLRETQRCVDGELSGARKEKIEAHIRECRECGEFSRSAIGMKAALKSNVCVETPVGLEQRIMNAVRAGAAPKRLREGFMNAAGLLSRKLVPVTALVCLLMLLMVVATYQTRTRTASSATGSEQVGSYYKFTPESHEKAMLSEDDDSAAGSFYSALVAENQKEKTQQ